MAPSIDTQIAVKKWEPTAKQVQFLSIPDTVFEGLFGGAAGGGKSETLLLLPIVRGFIKHPRFKGILFRRTFPELEREIIERSWLWYPATGAEYNSDKKQWQWPSRAIMRFGHIEYERDARKYDTDEYNLIEFDELTSFTEFQYIYLSSRCRTSSPDLPNIMRSGTNPGNIGHAFVRNRFISPGGKEVPSGTILRDGKTGLKRVFIQSLIKDNPHIDQEYYNRLGILDPAERAAKRDGQWDSFVGQVFSDWREFHIPGEPEHAIHVCDPFDIPNWWPRVLAIDWGFAASTVALWGAISPEGRLYIYREYETSHTKIVDWSAEVAKLSAGETLSDVVMCASAWQNRGDEELIHEQFTKYSGLLPRPADNARIAGIQMMQEYIRWTPKITRKVISTDQYSHELALSIMRNQGMDAYKTYITSFEPEEEESNLPKLQVFSSCPGLKKTIPMCIYGKKDNISGKPSEDVQEFKGDDYFDTCRYVHMAADRIRLSPELVTNLQRVNNTVLALSNGSIDMTSYYRRMEKIEHGPAPVVRPIKRFHRGRS